MKKKGTKRRGFSTARGARFLRRELAIAAAAYLGGGGMVP